MGAASAPTFKTMQSKLTYVLFLICAFVFAEARIELGLETRDVQVGEQFALNVVISDAKDIKEPVFPQNAVFKCLGMTPQRQNSTQISIVNGKYTKNVINNTTYRISLVASKEGVQVIPSIVLEVDGKQYRTQPIQVNVSKAEVISDIGLELEVPCKKCYVGQPIMLTWHWYIGREIGAYKFDLPVLSGEDFLVPSYTAPKWQDNSYQVPNTANVEMAGRLRRAKWNGYDMQSMDFRHPVIPKKAGTLKLEAGTLFCEVPDTRRRRARRSFFDDGFFGTPMRQISIAGNSVELQVLELPAEGKPASFSGIIGKCSISASATPLDVNVGDPIALTVTVSGLPYPEGAKLPSMSSQEKLAQLFRISDEDSGTVKDGVKQFQCTIRANDASVQEIPPLALSYFNVDSGKYEVIYTAAIPIKVHQVKTVTAQDAVGLPGNVAVGDMGKKVKALDDGIAHNYPPAEMLGNCVAGFSNWGVKDWRTMYCGGWMLLYILMAAVALAMHIRNASPEMQAFRAEAAKALDVIDDNGASAQDVAAAILTFIRARLHLPAGAETLADVEPALRKKGFPEKEMSAVKALFEACEAVRYSGGGKEDKALQEEARRIARVINSKVRS